MESAPAPTHRACTWCAHEFMLQRRPGRPRLYCGHACRQRAYEHRHGFLHERTVRALPGQASGDAWGGTGYERGGMPILGKKTHAMRTSVRPVGRRRETLCGLLVTPITGLYFSPLHRHACRTCTLVAERRPLRHGVSLSNELARLRALIDEAAEHRAEPAVTIAWLRANAPNGHASNGHAPSEDAPSDGPTDGPTDGDGGGSGGNDGGASELLGGKTGTNTRSR